MNAERLLAHYEKIAEAPDAIARLRRFVLDLAVRGKLVPQDASDEPASALLKRIATEKARLVKAGELRKPRDFGTGDDVVGPYSIPSTWRWVRLDGVGAIVGGGTPSASDTDNFADPGEGVPWLTPADLGGYSELFISRGSRDLSETGARTSSATLMPKGTVLFTSRAPIGYVAIAANPMSTNQGFKSIVPYIADCSRFIATAMKAFAPAIDAKAPGTTFKEVSGKIVAAVPFPLPPLAEQRRIVAKVDELMGLCDQLEASRADREGVRDRLTAASLSRLNATDPETFQDDARFALDALPALTTRPNQIRALRQTILNLAVRGKLVPQDANDKVARLPPLRQFAAASGMDDEVFDQFKNSMALPSGWQIAPLARLSENIVDCPHTTPKWTESGEICIRTNQLRPRALDLSESRYVSPEAYLERVERLEPKADDILYSREGGILGIACRVPPSVRLCLGQRLMLIRAGAEARADFLEIVLNSPFITDIAKARTTGGAAPRVNMSTVRAYPIPLPPLAEQHRIVAKVDELMGLCDRLEVSLTAIAVNRRRLLDALLAQALAPTDASVSGVSDRQTVASVNGDQEKIIFAERSAYILSLAYERHRFARRERTFGHVKAQKILHLVEAEAGFDLGRAPIRDAAGPNDFKHMLAVEQWAREHERFVFETNGAGYVLRQLSDFDKSLATEHGPEPSARAVATRLIDLFVPMDMRQAEIFATVYSAWNNLLIDGKAPTDTEIVWAARDGWHPDKLKLPARDFFAALAKLRLEGIVPKGTGKFVHGPLQKDLFN